MNVREPALQSIVVKTESLVIEAHQMESSGVKIVNACGILLSLGSESIARSIAVSFLNPCSRISWRTNKEKDFTPGKANETKLEATTDWQTHTLKIPAKGTIVYLRVLLPKQPVEIDTIILKDATSTINWTPRKKLIFLHQTSRSTYPQKEASASSAFISQLKIRTSKLTRLALAPRASKMFRNGSSKFTQSLAL